MRAAIRHATQIGASREQHPDEPHADEPDEPDDPVAPDAAAV
jgi:hypothetical protein